MKEKWRYLSSRIYMLCVGLFLFLAVICLILCVWAARTGKNGTEAVFCTAVWLFGFLFFYFAVLRPYRKVDRYLQLFFAGYTNAGLKEEACILSPGTEELARVLVRLTESDQLLNANKRQAQYLALQNQINPHFLYNTLDSIRSEAMMGENQTVAEMTEALATFFRYTISKVENMVTLEEELENTKIYFLIQKHRYEDRVTLEIEYDKEDEVLLRYLLPKLTIQPVVENSILHGIERKIGSGTIRILLRCTEKRLLIRISDNGVGMAPEVLERLNHQLNQPVFDSIQLSKDKGGIAILNVNNRIHLIFGEEYGMTVYSTPGVGTDTEIHLPLITSERQLKNLRRECETGNFKNGAGDSYRAGKEAPE